MLNPDPGSRSTTPRRRISPVLDSNDGQDPRITVVCQSHTDINDTSAPYLNGTVDVFKWSRSGVPGDARFFLAPAIVEVAKRAGRIVDVAVAGHAALFDRSRVTEGLEVAYKAIVDAVVKGPEEIVVVEVTRGVYKIATGYASAFVADRYGLDCLPGWLIDWDELQQAFIADSFEAMLREVIQFGADPYSYHPPGALG